MHKILYIDDNDDNLLIFNEKFHNKFNITVSKNPAIIFNLLEAQSFDLILLDIHMPEKDGFQVLQEIKQSRFSGIPVIMFTSDKLQSIRYQALSSLACDIIYRTLRDKEIELRILNKIKIFQKNNGDEKYLKLASLMLNLETQEAFHVEDNLNLTPIEFKILTTLVKSYPEKIARDNLINIAWNQNSVLDRTVNTHLPNLRNKLPKHEFTIESPRSTGIVLKCSKNILPNIAKSAI